MDVEEIRQRLLRDESVRERIGRRAFEIYAERGYVGGREVEDWVQAENELLPQLIREEEQRLAMAEAALEPGVHHEETVSLVGSSKTGGKKQTAGGNATKASAAKSEKKTTQANKASTQAKGASKKTSKSTQP